MSDVYTHGHHESVLRSHTWRTAENSASYLLSSLRAGLDLLDVGCGPGTITVDLARRVAPGRTVGLDRAPDVLDNCAHTPRRKASRSSCRQATCTRSTFRTRRST
jgi:ubiquinone/menaquinone biosynthesis C-methylase UbiE